MATKTKTADARKALVAEYFDLQSTKLGLAYDENDADDKEFIKAAKKRPLLVLASDVAKLKQLGDFDVTPASAAVEIPITPNTTHTRGIDWRTNRREAGITDDQLKLIIKLSLEKFGVDITAPEHVVLLGQFKANSKQKASTYIKGVIGMPRYKAPGTAVPAPSPTGRLTRSTPVMQNFPPVRTAVAAPAEIPAGIYAIEDDEVKCYTVGYGKEGSRWEGFLFLERISSDDRWPIKNRDEKARILAAISVDVEASGILAGHTLRQCRRCRRMLSDTKNPYFEVALGPECGSKM